jgi:hypothetical protein
MRGDASSSPAARTGTPAVTATRTPAVTPTVTTKASSYADLGAFGGWARRLDGQYTLKPDFADWDAVANANCDLQRKGEADGEYVPDTMAARWDVFDGDGPARGAAATPTRG